MNTSVKKLTILSKSRSCYTEELYSNDSKNVTISSARNQIRFETSNNTEGGKLEQASYNEGILMSKNTKIEL